MAHGRNGTVVLEVTLAEMPSSARLWETEQTLQGRGGETHSGMCAGAGGGSAPTFALEAVSGRGEQESVSHGLRAAAAGDAGLLIPSFHPF